MSLAGVVYVRESKNKSVAGKLVGVYMWRYESPILRNISSSVLNATGLTRLSQMSVNNGVGKLKVSCLLSTHASLECLAFVFKR
jgi:hypothetical protein